MRRQLLSFTAMVAMATGCYSNDPTSVQYQKSQAAAGEQNATPAPVEPAVEDDAGGEPDPAALQAQGEEAFTSKWLWRLP